MGRIAEIQRRHLEQIMGSEAMGIVTAEVSLWDPKVCRSFVAGTCVHDLFANTKMDIGPCTRIHQAKLKNEWTSQMEEAEKNKDQLKIAQLNQFRVDHERTIFGYVDECDRKVRAAQRRLEKTPEENNRTLALMREIGEIEAAHTAAMAEVEKLGAEGLVDESIAELAKADALKAEKADKERELQNLSETAGASGHQKLRVCDICGAYLSVLDSDRRLADHFGGKMHIGYLQIRTMMDEWRARGPLKTAPPPAPETLNRPKEADLGPPPPATFRPIPPEKRLNLAKPPPPPPMSPPRGAPTGPSSERAPPAKAGSAYGGSDRRDERERDRRDDRERDARDSRGYRDGGDDRRSSSRRYDDDDHRRSDRDRRDGDSYRSSRRDDEHRSDSRRDDDRRTDDRRSSSRRYDDDDVVMRSSRSRREEDDSRSSSRRQRDEPEAGAEAKPEVRAVSSSSHNNHSRSAARESRARSTGEGAEDRSEEKRRRVD